ncbi:hypothetical protein VNO77_05114 [Canavalia gladiata]|uniref:Transmembrane protein n=1 Tax=Canavalia gladiata TaxID=3824 RepID=A0AAN9R9P4_CANGL
MSLTLRYSVPLMFLFLLPLVADSSLVEVLNSHGLPAGLFPQSVKSYNLDQTGGLEVHLERPCLAQYETRVFFDSVVRTNISFGQLKVLDGMSQEELFLWLPVKDIIVSDPSSGLILIDIGLAYKHLSLSRFEDPPICNSLGTSSLFLINYHFSSHNNTNNNFSGYMENADYIVDLPFEYAQKSVGFLGHSCFYFMKFLAETLNFDLQLLDRTHSGRKAKGIGLILCLQ